MLRLPVDDAGGLDLELPVVVGLDRALAVDRDAQRVDHAAEHRLADRHLHDLAGPLDRHAFLDFEVRPEDDGADVVLFQVEGHAHDPARKFEQLVGHRVFESVQTGDAVADR